MMWKNFNVIFENNDQKKNNLKKNISILSDERTGYLGPAIQQNMDCLMHVLSELTIAERVNCRLVCKSWRTAVDKLFSGQRCLKILLNKSTKTFVGSYSERSAAHISIINPLMTYKMRKQIQFQSFHQMMSNYPSLQTLVIQDLPLTDIMIYVVTNTCRQLTSLSLMSCIARTDYYTNNNNVININSICDQITTYGWKLLINSYGQSLKHLTIRDCRLNDADCGTVLQGFPHLASLDLSDNGLVKGSELRLLGNSYDCVLANLI